MQHLDDAALLRQQGHRLTPQRLQVPQVIKSHGCHITAEEIHAAIVPQQRITSPSDPTIGRARSANQR